jgi:chemotaxis methyl-accepting protein methylase/signal transduction histidine kinase/chemotaxis response regulator CheB
MAFVIIQHLDPTHTSFLAEALTKETSMPVSQAEHGKLVEPNNVYVIPPNADIAIVHGRLTLFPRSSSARKLHLPVDFFFRALAEDLGSHAIGVVLSGSASDGTEGLKAIKAANGITFAQDPKTAKFGGMPHSAIDAGVVDYSLPVAAIARELVRLSNHPYEAAGRTPPERNDPGTLHKIFDLVRRSAGIDFSEYKAPTFERRLSRRMALRQVEDLQAYLSILQREPEESQSLYEDILVHVTSFFRDPEVFEALKTRVFPEILKQKAEGVPVRLWVAGCSTGEEVYSLAIALLEFMGDGYRTHAVQIFGSDVSEKAIEKARLGVYSDSAMQEMSDERRRHYFTKGDSGYRISKNVRDLCVFVRHDLARDPPFSKLDLVSCRNVLIYFDPVLQRRVIPTFHFSLNQPGFLLLGRTESIPGFSQWFSPVDKMNKVFARTAAPSTLRFAQRTERHPLVRNELSRGSSEHMQRTVDLGKHLDHMLLSRYSPPGVLINEKLEILQFRGDTGAFLQPAPGEPQCNLLQMARSGLLSELRRTIAVARKDMAPARAEGVELEQNGARTTIDIAVIPFTGLPDSSERLFVVMFEQAARMARAKAAAVGSRNQVVTPEQTRRILRLEHELSATREYLQSLIEDLGRTNDELNAANEELVSSNEELQSMNEELETAKEELQATNEELTTVNDELHSRHQEASRVNSDLVNLLSTVDVPLLILDMDRRIRRFTPKARDILNVLPADIGRPLEDIRINIDVPDMNEQIAGVIEANTIRESEVQDRSGRWYRMQIRPYKTTDNKIDGAMLSLVDIDALKQHIGDAEQARAEAERANSAKDQFLATLSHELRTPLSTMLMHAQMLHRNEADPKVKRAGEAIERATRMQAQLIDDLLDVSRIVAGKLRMEVEPVDLGVVIRAALESVSALIEKKAINIIVAVDDSVGKVSGDPSRLQQVVLNLLTNAIKFTPSDGQVTLSLEAANGQAVLTVSDTGIGIAPGFLPSIFNRFTQEDGSTTRLHGGLGLGLAIVRHLVEAHGGTVRAESDGVGKGATMVVMLPLISAFWGELDSEVGAPSGEAPPASCTVADDGTRLKGVRVLVVDDDPELRETLAEMLRRIGAKVRLAQSAGEAITVVERFRPEVLLCDIAMPGEDGYSFIRKLRAAGADRGGDTPALALTALVGEENRQLALTAGFQMYMPKPIDVERLTLAVLELSHRGAPSLLGSPGTEAQFT